MIGAAAVDALKHGVQNGKRLHIPVVVYGGNAVILQMIGVDHVHIVEIGCGGLIGQVHRMLQRQVPDGEGLKLGIAGVDAVEIFMIQLAQADRQLAGAGAGSRHHHQRPLGLHKLVFAKALLADDAGDVIGIALDGIMPVDPQAQLLQLLLEGLGGKLAAVAGDDHRAHIQAKLPEGVDQAEHILIVGDAKIAPDLVFNDIPGVDGDDDLRLVRHGFQHLDLAVRRKARQDPGRMIIVKQLSAKLQIKLAAKLLDAPLDLLRLPCNVDLIVKALLLHALFPVFPSKK